MKGIFRQVWEVDGSGFRPGAALRALPAVALSLGVGGLTGRLGLGGMAAAGAFSVGFGALGAPGETPLGPMLGASLGICLASWGGTWAGRSDVGSIAAMGVAGALYAIAARRGPSAAWVSLKAVIWLVVSSAYPAEGLEILTRGSLALGGGLLQTVTVAIFRWMEGPGKKAAPVSKSPGSAPGPGAALRASERYSVGLAVTTMIVAGLLDRGFAAPQGYWIPLTAAVVLRPALRQTLGRGLSRMVGTLAGAALATVIAAAWGPSPPVLGALVLAFAGLSYALIPVNYAAYAVCVTAYVVFLLSLYGLPQWAVIRARVEYTLLGGLVALGVSAVFSMGARRSRPEPPPAGRPPGPGE